MNRKFAILTIAAGIILIPVLISPIPRFRLPLSTVVEAADGSLLGARIADDGQWRFPAPDHVPEKFEKALLAFEDRYFYYHPGINPAALIRAFKDNIKAHGIVSGGSTITMQVARLSRGNKPRTYGEKFIEMLEALKLETLKSKKEILQIYAANAPFGGNNVGLDAAAWRYMGKSPDDLTWAEAAALAVLPNSPSIVFPGKNQEAFKKRRDKLLRTLNSRGIIDSLSLVLALDEPLPGEPKPLPSGAPHLTDYFYRNNKGQKIRTTIDPAIQERAVGIINSHQNDLSGNQIFNSAALIIQVSTGSVLAYVGNSNSSDISDHGGDVDIIRSVRSTGSILKPLLYAAMQQSGILLPNTLVADIPTRFPGFTPENFDMSFSGAVPAGNALSQSLNIPAVRMLQEFSPEHFLELLNKTGFTTFDKPAAHYGLSLILGGGETSLWELTGVYSSCSRVLNRYNKEKKYYRNDFHMPVLIPVGNNPSEKVEETDPPLSASAIWLTYEALKKVNRPETEAGWQYFSSAPEMAWKTGTSFGFRDAWAVGTTPDYVIGVWAGNADGEGRPGLTGISAAAPILFDLAGIMKPVQWFTPPYEEMTSIRVCSKSGCRAGPDCPETEEVSGCVSGLRSDACPYHRVVHLNKSGSCQVTTDCYPSQEIISRPWFVLPPAMEYFYRKKHSDYNPLPAFAQGCKDIKSFPVMEFIYPSQGVNIFIPRDHTGQPARLIAEAVHRIPAKKLFWHLDEKYLASTKVIHQVEVFAEAGNHVLTVVDEDGNIIRCSFKILNSVDRSASP
ncbi:MAG: penicillin-binding protein 1C [Bacteroidota bacterium]|nr:penicillin-binding protein 1C [Bacteroidota bacterium]